MRPNYVFQYGKEVQHEATATTFFNQAFLFEATAATGDKMNESLSNCVASLKSSNQSLATSVAILDSAVSDYPRIQRVLKSNRPFELTSAAAIGEAQRALVNEIQPEAQRLLRITEQIIAKMERKETGLISKAELQEGRITGYGKKPPTDEARLQKEREQERAREIAASRANAERLKQLQAKKERIAYAVERMELQVKQKERELRMVEGNT